jgi:hypothetical protein
VGCLIAVLSFVVVFFLVDLAILYVPWWGWFTFVPAGLVLGAAVVMGLSE